MHQDKGKIFKTEKTPEGYLRVWLTVSRVGDLEYYRSDGTKRIETLSREELFQKDSLDTAWGKPISIEHPDEEDGITADNFKKYAVGLTQQGMVINSDFLTIVGVLTDPEAIAIAQGGSEISAGYHTDVVEKNGKFYQTARRYNHFALVPHGRAGKDVRIHVDNFRCDAIGEGDRETLKDAVGLTKEQLNLEEMVEEKRKITIDSIEYPVVPDLAQAIIALQNDREAKSDSLTAYKNDLAAKEAQIAALKARVDELEKQNNDGAIAQEVADRLQVWGEVGEAIPRNDSLSAIEIKQAYLQATCPDLATPPSHFQTDNEKNAWVSAMYESKKPNLESERKDAIAKTNGHLALLENQSIATPVDAIETAREKYAQNREEAIHAAN